MFASGSDQAYGALSALTMLTILAVLLIITLIVVILVLNLRRQHLRKGRKQSQTRLMADDTDQDAWQEAGRRVDPDARQQADM
jgi:competence protein ComGC